jgi:hypothetical protein
MYETESHDVSSFLRPRSEIARASTLVRRVLLPTIVKLLAATVAVLLASTAPVRADIEDIGIRNTSASARSLGCSVYVPTCDGVTQSRLGFAIVDVAYELDENFSLVGMYQSSARPYADDLLFAQVLTGAGPRWTYRRFWFQTGVGLAARGIKRGPKTLKLGEILDRADPAVLAGIGRELGSGRTPTVVALDASTAVALDDGESTYQLTASITRVF